MKRGKECKKETSGSLQEWRQDLINASELCLDASSNRTASTRRWMASPFDSRNVIWDTMGVFVPRWARDHRSIAPDRLFLLPWGQPVNKVNPMQWEPKNKREGTALGRRRSKKRRLTLHFQVPGEIGDREPDGFKR
uniref:Uncharacterized protein n=1 Tax=Nymphaea colorata TaxID=210225 RepID=A0A5K1H822_9MAGN|nr:unnamed protein product [Nymphaea colorata]